jgi:hypothetical protein
MNGKNGKIPDLVMNDFARFVRDNDDLISDINVDFPPEVERMIAQMKVILQDFPRQQEIAATFARGRPSLEWLVAYRRRQFTSLWLQYATLPTDEEKDAFCDSLVGWWKLVVENEKRAALHLAEHKRRARA